MNVELSEKLLEDSQKIDAGIRRLQSKLTDVIDGITNENADPQAIIAKHKTEIMEIANDLKEFLSERDEFDKTVESAENEIAMYDTEIKKIIAQYKINVEELDLDGFDIEEYKLSAIENKKN